MNSGAYQLLIEINRKVKIQIGNLGKFTFEKGSYIYTGSAMKNLSQRVERHIRTNFRLNSKLHWHIDFLLSNKYVKITDIKFYQSNSKIECQLNQELLKKNNIEIPVKKFGSSDCTQCPSHLLKFTQSPKFRKV